MNDADAVVSFESARRAAGLPPAKGLPLSSGNGGGTFEDMEQRVTRLETHFEYIRRDLDEVRADQKQVLTSLQVVKEALSGFLQK